MSYISYSSGTVPMKIKTKLILNMVIGAVAIWSIVITSIFSMTFIKGKLSYLTQKSTPYQMRTVEFQKELQSAITDLVKVNAARDLKEFQTFKSEAEKSLASFKTSQQALEEMSNSKLGAEPGPVTTARSCARSASRS